MPAASGAADVAERTAQQQQQQHGCCCYRCSSASTIACSTAGSLPAAAAVMQFAALILNVLLPARTHTRPFSPTATSKGRRMPRRCRTKLSRRNKLQNATARRYRFTRTFSSKTLTLYT